MISAEKRRSFTFLKNFNFFVYGTFALLMPFLPLYFQGIGFNNVQIGLLMSVGPIVSLIANPFWGYWSDRLQNIRKILTIMLFGNLIISQMVFQITEFIPLFTIMLFFYFFQTALNPMSNSLILHAIEKTSYNFGSFRLWGSLGFAFMAIAASPVIEWLGVNRLGFIYGFFLLITIGLCFQLPKQGKQSSSFSTKGLSKIFLNPYFVTFLILSILMSIPNRVNSIFISIYIAELGGSEIYVGLGWFIAAVGEIPIFLLMDRYLKKTSRVMIGILVIVSLLFALRWVLMGIVVSPMQVVLVQTLQSVTFGMYFYTGTQLCAHLIPITYRASGQAVYALTWMGISGIIAGLFGGWMYDFAGPRGMYGICTIMATVGALGFLVMWLRLRKVGGLRADREASA